MAMQNKRSMIDTRCKELQPGWGPKERDGELQMLYDALNDDESIESLVGCVWGPENAFRPNANRWDKMRQYDGIAVVTGSRVILLKKRGMNKLKTEMPLHALKSVDVDGEGEVTLTGRSYSDWAGDGGADAFKLRDVQDGSTRAVHFNSAFYTPRLGDGAGGIDDGAGGVLGPFRGDGSIGVSPGSDHHLSALGGQGEGYGPPNAPAAAGDDRNFPLQRHRAAPRH